MPGKPYIDLYVGDWKKDPNVQTLTLAEKGAWIEILMLMHESEYRGKLLIRGEPMTLEVLAGLLRIDNQTTEHIVGRLIATGVADFNGNPAVLSCRRMVREEKLHRNKVAAGKAGGLAKALANKQQTPNKQGSETLAPLDIDSDTDSEAVTRKKKKVYTEEFDLVWGMYPSRGDHSNPKLLAFKAWKVRLKEGVPTAHLIAAVKRYAQECADNGKIGTEHVMQACTFFGPNERWKEYHEKDRKVKAAVPVATEPLPDIPPETREAQLKEIKKAREELAARTKEGAPDE